MAVFIGSISRLKKKCTWCDRITMHKYRGVEFGIGRFEVMGYRGSSYNFLVLDSEYDLNIGTEFKRKKDAILLAERKIDLLMK